MRCCVSPAAWLRLTRRSSPSSRRTFINGIVSLIPDIWLRDGVPFDTPTETRQAYSQWLLSRLDASQLFVEEAQNARPKFV